jgi:hypothetical protein
MIIIPSHVSRIDTWLKDCLASLDTKHKVMVVFQGDKPAKGLKIGFDYTHQALNGYDPGAVVWAINNLEKDDEFMVLHDSCVVKDNLLFKVVFEGYFEDSVALSTHPTTFGMFLGKYRTKIASQLEPPVAEDKAHGVDLEESWNREYCQLEQPIVLDNPLTTSDVFEIRHGRENMILENRWIKKYKGTWKREQL